MSTSEHGSKTRWPWWGQFLLAVIALVTASGLLIFMPVLSASQVAGDGGAGGLAVWGPMFSVLIGITSMTITGIFVFMTFRIDRGARAEAREVAKEVAQEEAGKDETIRKAKEQVMEMAGEAKGAISTAKANVDEVAKKATGAMKATIDRVKYEEKTATEAAGEAKEAIFEAKKGVADAATGAKRAIGASANSVAGEEKTAVNAANEAKGAIKAHADNAIREVEEHARDVKSAMFAAEGHVKEEEKKTIEAMSAARDRSGPEKRQEDPET